MARLRRYFNGKKCSAKVIEAIVRGRDIQRLEEDYRTKNIGVFTWSDFHAPKGSYILDLKLKGDSVDSEAVYRIWPIPAREDLEFKIGPDDKIKIHSFKETIHKVKKDSKWLLIPPPKIAFKDEYPFIIIDGGFEVFDHKDDKLKAQMKLANEYFFEGYNK